MFSNVLKNSDLFKGIAGEDILVMLKCLGASTVSVEKDRTILHAGSKPDFIGIILTGKVNIFRDDIDGNRTLLATLTKGDLFAEALCCAGIEESPVGVEAVEKTTVLVLKFARIINTCSNTCIFHTKLIENMLYIIAKKNLWLQNRIEITSFKSIQKKVSLYLSSYVTRKGEYFEVPHNRERMAEYLCVDRSALSHTLSKMKKEGLIDYKRNNFVLFKSLTLD